MTSQEPFISGSVSALIAQTRGHLIAFARGAQLWSRIYTYDGMTSLALEIICIELLCATIGDLCEVNLHPIGLSSRAGILMLAGSRTRAMCSVTQCAYCYS